MNKPKLSIIRSRLLNKIGYEFQNPDLFDQALTHKSFSKTHNERLEFIGDSILNCTVAQALYFQLPKASEGDLSQLRAQLVCEETLAEIAIEWSLGQCLNLGSGELKSGGFNRPSILSDAVEAIIGAIYVDGGMEASQEAVRRWYQSRLVNARLVTRKKDAKTRLQEFVQAKQIERPVYEVVAIRGEDHQQEFEVHCSVPKLLDAVKGIGRSRKIAEQQAAEMALTKLGRK